MQRMQNCFSHCTNMNIRLSSRPPVELHLLATAASLKRAYEQPHDIAIKGAIDLATETDLAAEAIISASLSNDTPDIMIMAEETITSHSLETDRYWVVDPLDGTTNFAHGFPYFAVSIALLDHGRPLVGAVYAPLLDELFCVSKGSGSWLNDRIVTVTKTRRLIEGAYRYIHDK